MIYSKMKILAHISSDDGRYTEHWAAGRRTISNLRGLVTIQLHKIVDQGVARSVQNTATKVENGLSAANRVCQKLATTMYRAPDRNTNIHAQWLVLLFGESCFALAE